MLLVLKSLPDTVLGIYGKNKVLPERMRFLHPDAAASYIKLEASQTRLRVSDMFRSAEASLEAIGKRGTQKPAYSGHNFGFSIDIDVTDCMKRFSMSKSQLDEFMEDYGWYCHRTDHKVDAECWHYNFFGAEATEFLKYETTNRGPALEKKIEKYYGSQLKLRSIEIQQALRKLGMYSGAIDGKLGPITKEALKVFQRAWKLEEDGEASPMTQRTLAYVSADRQVVG